MLKMDALIAATAAIKGLKIVTKNTHDFNRMYQNIAVNWAGYT